MKKLDPTMAQQVAEAISVFQERRTGDPPKAVTVVLGDDTLVVTLHEALSPVEKALARTPERAAQVQEFRLAGRISARPGTRTELDRAISHKTGRVCHVSPVEKSQESVLVGGSDAFHRLLKVTVLGIKGAHVKLGFEVDAEVPVHRSEVWERINGNGRAESPTGGPARTTEVKLS